MKESFVWIEPKNNNLMMFSINTGDGKCSRIGIRIIIPDSYKASQGLMAESYFDSEDAYGLMRALQEILHENEKGKVECCETCGKKK